MPVIKATDIAWGRIRSPDLDKQEEFLTHFGMVRAARTKTALYMRGTDAAHHLHVTELGEPRHVGLGFYAASADDLKKFAKVEGASGIEHVDEPGGGQRVRLKDPDGYQVQVVHDTVFLIKGDKTGLNHLSYEAADIDDVMIGHEHLKAKGYNHMWGMGRHLLGSQVFDYWADPWNRVHEHWADTDVLNAKTPSGLFQRGPDIAGPWGEPLPERFMGHATP